MGKKYIIELEETPFIQHFKNGAWETIYRVKGFNSLVFDWNGLQMLTPYTEPDMEQVRKEAYRQGYDTGYGTKVNEFYEQGLIDAWDAARKIADIPYGEEEKVFGSDGWTFIANHTAQEAIEEIRQYEQEKDRQARIEYNFDEIKDVINTTMKKCNVSLDDIASILQRMKEET